MNTDIKTWAIEGADQFAKVWSFNDFWKRSNTFHCFLRFVDAAEERWGKNDPALGRMRTLRAEMIEANSTYFDGFIGGDTVWADDYGWCGISCLTARDYLLSIGDRAKATKYVQLADRCWNQMIETGYDTSDSATPVPHGCGNISPERKRDGGGYGTKNTVTNANLLLLSLRLYGIDGFSNYLDRAISQYVWFGNWFSKDYVSCDDGRYLRTIPGPLALIHERPMAEKSYVEKFSPTWERGWVWTGDQGLMMMVLAELLVLGIRPPGFDQTLFYDAFVTMAAGIEVLLFGATDRVLREAPFGSSFNHTYAGDYVGGRGVLLRYVSENTVRKALGRWLNPEGITATAQAVWNSRDSRTNQFASLWNKAGDAAFDKNFVQWWGSGNADIGDWHLDSNEIVAGVLQANGLDALTAAIRLGAG